MEKKYDENTIKKVEKAWKNTVNTLLVVDSFTAAVSFATIFTLPGGSDETSGLALFEHKTLLWIFVLFDSRTLSALFIVLASWTDYKWSMHVVP